ncbi:MAG: FAD-binding oxidoreductase [Chitinophagaceae bacterium]|nr:FAD-binding oxidoreductase [Chitinophagaceae bacterium]
MNSTNSIWEDESIFCKNDFLIIGGGLAGLWCAFELQLKFKNARILILERGIFPTGASTRNAGFACFGSPTEMMYNADVMGEDKMWATVEMRYKGILKIRKIFGDAVIDYDHCGGYECLQHAQALQVDEKLPWLNKRMKAITGNENSFSWSNEKLDQFGLKGFDNLIENSWEGGLHSGKLVLALQKHLQSNGVLILMGMEVSSIQKYESGYEVLTQVNQTFTTTNLIYCTNAFTQNLLPALAVTPARGQVVVTSPIDGLQLKGTFHYDEGYYYFRNVGNRVLLGGARNKSFDNENTTELTTTPSIQDELFRFLTMHILPGKQFTLTNQWSGIMGFTANKEPVVEKVDENAYAVISCNGMGVALSPVIAEKVAAMF